MRSEPRILRSPDDGGFQPDDGPANPAEDDFIDPVNRMLVMAANGEHRRADDEDDEDIASARRAGAGEDEEEDDPQDDQGTELTAKIDELLQENRELREEMRAIRREREARAESRQSEPHQTKEQPREDPKIATRRQADFGRRLIDAMDGAKSDKDHAVVGEIMGEYIDQAFGRQVERVLADNEELRKQINTHAQALTFLGRYSMDQVRDSQIAALIDDYAAGYNDADLPDGIAKAVRAVYNDRIKRGVGDQQPTEGDLLAAIRRTAGKRQDRQEVRQPESRQPARRRPPAAPGSGRQPGEAPAPARSGISRQAADILSGMGSPATAETYYGVGTRRAR